MKMLAISKNRFVALLIALLGAGLLLVLTGCSRPEALNTGDRLPEIAVVDLTGKPVKLADVTGNVLLIQFWKSGCCSAVLPVIDTVHAKYKDDGFSILAINVKETARKLAATVDDLRLSFPLLRDPLLITLKRFEISALPTAFLVDRDMIIREKIIGHVPESYLEQKVAELL